jgi:hypothetical protein
MFVWSPSEAAKWPLVRHVQRPLHRASPQRPFCHLLSWIEPGYAANSRLDPPATQPAYDNKAATRVAWLNCVLAPTTCLPQRRPLGTGAQTTDGGAKVPGRSISGMVRAVARLQKLAYTVSHGSPRAETGPALGHASSSLTTTKRGGVSEWLRGRVPRPRLLSSIVHLMMTSGIQEANSQVVVDAARHATPSPDAPAHDLATRTDAVEIRKEAETYFRKLPLWIQYPQSRGRRVPLFGSGISPRASVDLLVKMTDEQKADYIAFSERMERWFELTDAPSD